MIRSRKIREVPSPDCRHREFNRQDGLCIITIGDSLLGDACIASALLDKLPEEVTSNVCKFDLGANTNNLNACFKGHRAAIIVDSTCDGMTVGSVTLIDLKALIDNPGSKINSIHGFSLVDELTIARQSGLLPEQLILFGIDVEEVDWTRTLSAERKSKISKLIRSLSLLIERVLEALGKHS